MTALTTFTVLTIGDGLVTAIPSLLISIAGGLVTTRAASDVSMGENVATQLFSNPKPVYFGSGIVAGLGLDSRVSEVLFLLSRGDSRLHRHDTGEAAQERARTPVEKAKDATPEKATAFLKIDSLAIEIGYGLIGLVDVATRRRLHQPHSFDPQASRTRPRRHRAAREYHRQPEAGRRTNIRFFSKAWRSRAAN